jgi:hypothetical protein
LNKLSGLSTDYVGGDNACHPRSAGFVSLNAGYSVQPIDIGKYFICSGGSWTLNLPAPVNGFNVRIRNDQGITGTTGTITLTPPSGTIDGLANQSLLPGQECTLISDGTNWRTLGRARDVVIGAIDITAVANQLILLPVGYRMFEIDIYSLQPSTSGSSFWMLLSSNGGSSFATSAYYDNIIFNSSTTALGYSYVANGAQGRLTTGLRNSAADGGQVKLRFWPGDGTRTPSWLGQSLGFASGIAAQVQYEVAGNLYIASQAIINAIQFQYSSGNIGQGSIVVRGIV